MLAVSSALCFPILQKGLDGGDKRVLLFVQRGELRLDLPDFGNYSILVSLIRLDRRAAKHGCQQAEEEHWRSASTKQPRGTHFLVITRWARRFWRHASSLRPVANGNSLP